MKILVIGELILDKYLLGRATRLSPEAPVPVVEATETKGKPGGAANVIANLLALDVEVHSIGFKGKSQSAIEEMLQLHGECIWHYVDQEVTYPTKTRVISGSQQILRFDSNDYIELTKKAKIEFKNLVESLLCDIDAVIISDYNKGLLCKDIISSVMSWKKSCDGIVVVDTKREDVTPYKEATSLTPNLPEARIILSKLGTSIPDNYIILAKTIREEMNLLYGIITLGENGAVIATDETTRHIPALKSDVFDVTGAGDTFIAVFTFFISSGLGAVESVEYSIQAASQVVGQLGTAVPDLKDIYTKYSDSKVCKIEDLIPLVNLLKRQGRHIGFTNGCFDILHAGHVSYLQEARSQCDLLIVALNSDASIKRLKGDLRPINSLEQRQTVISELRSVSFIITFEEDTPEKLIRRIKPEILFKGADYSGKTVIGSEYSGETRLIKIRYNVSTTDIIRNLLRKNKPD